MTTTKIAVFGIGAIGGSIAADLADVQRHEVQLCTRTPIDKLEVMHPTGTSRVGARVVCDPNETMPVDWLLLATKAYQSPGAAPWLKKLCTAKTVVGVRGRRHGIATPLNDLVTTLLRASDFKSSES